MPLPQVPHHNCAILVSNQHHPRVLRVALESNHREPVFLIPFNLGKEGQKRARKVKKKRKEKGQLGVAGNDVRGERVRCGIKDSHSPVILAQEDPIREGKYLHSANPEIQKRRGGGPRVGIKK